MRIIGLTGGIACGKSTFTAHLQEWNASSNLGIVVIDCDKIAKHVASKGKPCVMRIREAFGESILKDPTCSDPQEMELDRKALGEIVFKDKAKLKQLVGITGPAITKELGMHLLYHFVTGTSLVILDAPTLFESKSLLPLCAAVIVVASDQSLQINRILSRDGLSEDLARDRITSQLPLAEKVEKADYIIWNNGSRTEFIEKIETTIAKVKRKYGGVLSRMLSLPGLAFVLALSFLLRQIKF